MEIDIGTARLSAIDDSDFIGVQIDGLGENPGLPPFELLSTYGFTSRPADPDASGRGCSAFYTTQGSEGFAWLANDPRLQSGLPNLRAGESCWYGPKGNFGRMHDDGTISLMTTTDGTVNGRAILLRLSPTDGFQVVGPWGRLVFNDTGFHVRHRSGARIDLGAIAGLLAPLDALGSYATMSAAMASINATVVSQGTDAGATNLAAVNALVALLATMAAAIEAKNGPPTGVVAAVAAATAAIENIGKVV